MLLQSIGPFDAIPNKYSFGCCGTVSSTYINGVPLFTKMKTVFETRKWIFTRKYSTFAWVHARYTHISTIHVYKLHSAFIFWKFLHSYDSRIVSFKFKTKKRQSVKLAQTKCELSVVRTNCIQAIGWNGSKALCKR